MCLVSILINKTKLRAAYAAVKTNIGQGAGHGDL